MNASKHKTYCISGLGVDARVFDRIRIEQSELVHVPWIKPEKNESLKAYAKRLFDSVHPSEDYSILGVSFGGMIAQEWAKMTQPKTLILISTCSSPARLHPLLRFGGQLGLTNILHPKLALFCPPLLYYFFGVKKQEDKHLLKAVIRDTDPRFLRWASKAIMKWRCEKPHEAIKIHGSKDRIIRPESVLELSIAAAGHFCIHTHGSIVSTYLNAINRTLEQEEQIERQ